MCQISARLERDFAIQSNFSSWQKDEEKYGSLFFTHILRVVCTIFMEVINAVEPITFRTSISLISSISFIIQRLYYNCWTITEKLNSKTVRLVHVI